MFSRIIRSTAKSQYQQLRFNSTAYKAATDALRADMKAAMLAKDKAKRDTVKGIITAIKNKELATKPSQHDEFMIHSIYKTLIQQRKDSIEEFTKHNRTDLVEKETQEIELISKYMSQLNIASDEEVLSKVTEKLNELQKDGLLSIGEVFKKINWVELAKEWNASIDSVRSTVAKIIKSQGK